MQEIVDFILLEQVQSDVFVQSMLVFSAYECLLKIASSFYNIQ